MELYNTPEQNSPIDREMRLLDEYAGTPMSSVLNNGLNSLKRFAGIGIPQFKIDNVSDEEVRSLLDITEKVGDFVELGLTHGPGDFATLQLRTPLEGELTQEEYNAADAETRYNYTKGKYGELIAAQELPEESKKLLDDIRGLIDAEIVRDEPGLTIHKGVYQGATVFLEQASKVYSEKGNMSYTVHSATLLGETAGETAIDELSTLDIAKAKAAGVDVFSLREAGVTRKTLDGYIGAAREIDEAGRIVEDELNALSEVDPKAGLGFDVKEFIESDLRLTGDVVRTTDGKDRTAELAGAAANAFVDGLKLLNEKNDKRNQGKVRRFLGKFAIRNSTSSNRKKKQN